MLHEVPVSSGLSGLIRSVALAGLAFAVGACAERPANETTGPSNRPPMLVVKTAATDQNVAVTVDLLDGVTDPDGDQLAVVNAVSPGNVVELQNARSVTVTPARDFVGILTVQYVVSDGQHEVDGALRVTVRRVDGRPTAFDEEGNVVNDSSLSLFLSGSDPEFQFLTFKIVAGPSNGTITGNPPSVTYRPNPDFVGIDSLMFTASDGEKTSEPATVTIHVFDRNHAPIATPQMVAAAEDTTINITLTGSDANGDSLQFFIRSGATNGTVSSSSGSPLVTYRPSPNYHGPDNFTFYVSDGRLFSAEATVTIDVASVDDPPVVVAMQRTLNEDTSTTVTLQGSDVEGDPISFAIADGPHHGSLSVSMPSVTYTPDPNYNGADSFTYTASDGTATSAPATVSLTVNSVNDPPVAVDSSVTTVEDTAVNLALQASDVDGQTLTYTIVTSPSDGILSSGTGANRTYTPAANATGVRSFKFRASDGVASSNTATVTITITPVNDPPTAFDDYVATDPATPLTIDVVKNDVDVDSDALTIASVDAPANGTVEIVDNKLVYTPGAGFTGVDVFAYTVTDPSNTSSSASVHVGVGAFPTGAPTETILALAVDTADPRNAPSMSSDGRYIAFPTMMSLVPDDTNGISDVYVYDRGTRSFARMSQTSDGQPANGASRNARISTDGRYVVFESIANNLAPGDTNASFDVFRHDRITGETVRVSVATGGGQGSGGSTDPRISDDGNRVVFASTAFDLVGNDANGASDIFVRDIAAGTTTRVSVSTTGGDADLPSAEPAISGDGRFVAFTSGATNLVAGDTNAVGDVFVRDLTAGTTFRVSVGSTGGEANQASSGASLSRDGRFVSFLSSATNLVAGVTGTTVYVRDIQALTTTHPPVTGSMLWAQLSADGRYLTTFASLGVGISICDRFTATTVVPAGGGGWAFPMFSGNGRYVAAIVRAGGGSLVIAPNPL